jgi:predicted amidophosphoribosyltransferase
MLVKCESCGKFFGTEDKDKKLCSSCDTQVAKTGFEYEDVEEQKFKLSRSIVYDNPDIAPDALIEQINETGLTITLKEIMKYVREGRLTMTSVDGSIFCEDCGKKILGGRLCPTCSKNLEKAISSRNKAPVVGTKEVTGGSEKHKGGGMHSRSSSK